jgi:hypothetical protein
MTRNAVSRIVLLVAILTSSNAWLGLQTATRANPRGLVRVGQRQPATLDHWRSRYEL